MLHEILQLSSNVSVAPVAHGSGDFARKVRHLIGRQFWDCIAVPLPPSFQNDLEQAILELPHPSAVIQLANPDFDDDPATDDGLDGEASYVPVEPCQPVVAAIRAALGEHIPVEYIDCETARFAAVGHAYPDAYALKHVPLEKYAAAVVPFLSPPPHLQWQQRVEHMAARLRECSKKYRQILFICGILEWPWIRQAFLNDAPALHTDEVVNDTQRYLVETKSLYFMLGELPYVTGLYEKARETLDDDQELAIDGVKMILLQARDSYRADYGSRARRITPKLLSTCLKYARNLTLLDRQLTPQLVTLVTAAQQTMGDGFALHVLETAKTYPYAAGGDEPRIRFGIGRAQIPDGDTLKMVSRLPGPPLVWRSLHLIPQPDKLQTREWAHSWNPFSQCSWPPEDESIENFRAAVFDRARQIMGQDLARTEKFTTSIKDGIDIRDTLRHWYDSEIYVKVLPPNQGKLDAVVMLFDSPADPRMYRWRSTWYAEHLNESTLAFFATSFQDNPVGPGICLSTYGGAMFLFPPVMIPDIWTDRRLNFAETLEERLISAGCLHSRSPRVALLSPLPPGPAWRKIAKHFRRQLVHVPLGQFSDETVQRLRGVHVLNGKHVRSYAADFIRKS
jgi:hypothetical protein